jgi:hypothetical protein
MRTALIWAGVITRWEVMRLQLDFAAQMLGHFFEGRDKIIADA